MAGCDSIDDEGRRPGRPAAWVQVLIWIVVAVGWMYRFRPFHPTWPVDVAATSLLVGSYAAAVYLDFLALRAIRETRGVWAYLAALMAAEAALTVLAVAAIQGVYAALWHPDPRRFGFGFNFSTDFLGMNIHVLAAALLARAWVRLLSSRRGPTRPSPGPPAGEVVPHGAGQ